MKASIKESSNHNKASSLKQQKQPQQEQSSPSVENDSFYFSSLFFSGRFYKNSSISNNNNNNSSRSLKKKDKKCANATVGLYSTLEKSKSSIAAKLLEKSVELDHRSTQRLVESTEEESTTFMKDLSRASTSFHSPSVNELKSNPQRFCFFILCLSWMLMSSFRELSM
jgi:hypothetical protein